MEYQANAGGVGTPAQVVVGLFNNANDAHLAVTQLRANGFSSQQIGAAFRSDARESYGDRSLSNSSAGVPAHESWWEKVKDAFRTDDRAEDTARVRTSNSEEGIDSEEYARSEYDYDFAGEDFAGSLAAAGIPAQRAAYLSHNLAPGGAIVTVRDADRSHEAEQILSANKARIRYEEAAGEDVMQMIPIGDRAVASESMTDRELAVPAYAERSLHDEATAAGDRVQLFGEVLRVHKERVNRGEARIRKEVVTENQTIEVPVTHEELLLERVPVSGDTPAPSANIGRDQEIRVPLSEETVRLEKEPVLREEFIVGKHDVSDVTTVSDQVRHEELRVDSEGVQNPRRTVAGEDLAEDARRRG